MSLPVSLRMVAEEIGGLPQGWTAWIDRKTGEVIALDNAPEWGSAGDIDDLPQWMREAKEEADAVLASSDFIALPDDRDIHEYEIMRRFIRLLDDDGAGAGHGPGDRRVRRLRAFQA